MQSLIHSSMNERFTNSLSTDSVLVHLLEPLVVPAPRPDAGSRQRPYKHLGALSGKETEPSLHTYPLPYQEMEVHGRVDRSKIMRRPVVKNLLPNMTRA